MKLVHAVPLVVLGCVVASARLAHAEPRPEPTPSELSLARRLFSEATALEDQGNWAAAAVKLREALAIKETPGLRYHLAHCEEQSGALVAASLEYARASELIRAGAQAPDVAQLLALADQRLLARIPKLTLRVPPDVEGVSVEIDGHLLASVAVGNAIPLDPGSHRVVARAPERAPFEATLALEPGESRTLELSLTRALPAAGAPLPEGTVRGERPAAPPAERRGITPRTVALAGAGTLALGGLGVGIGFAVVRAREADRAKRVQHELDSTSGSGRSACSGSAPSPLCADLRATLERHEQASLVMTLGFVGAGVGVAAGALTWALWPSSREHVSVRVGADGALLELAGRF